MRLNRLTISVLLIGALGWKGILAQESLVPSGGNATGSNGSMSYSVGQIAFHTNSTTEGRVTCGVQQPYEISGVSGISEDKAIFLPIRAYPNPVSDHLFLCVDESGHPNLQYQLYDLQGRLLYSEHIRCRKTKIPMNDLVPATYFIRVFQDNSDLISIKIIKK